jgi:hypothetical protein
MKTLKMNIVAIAIASMALLTGCCSPGTPFLANLGTRFASPTPVCTVRNGSVYRLDVKINGQTVFLRGPRGDTHPTTLSIAPGSTCSFYEWDFGPGSGATINFDAHDVTTGDYVGYADISVSTYVYDVYAAYPTMYTVSVVNKLQK